MKEFVEKLIERLEKEADSANDKINEQEFEKDMYYYDGFEDGFNESISIVNQLAEEYKSNLSEKLTGWIPVTERLPEIGENEFYPDVIITDKNGVVEIAIYNEQDEEWYVMDIYSEEYEVKKDVVAWQPLPEPYKPEEKQEETQTNFYAERFNKVN